MFIDFFAFDAYWFCVAGVVLSLFGPVGDWCCWWMWFWFVVFGVLLVLHVWFLSGFRSCGCVSGLLLRFRVFPGVGLVVILVVLVWHDSVGLMLWVCGFGFC